MQHTETSQLLVQTSRAPVAFIHTLAVQHQFSKLISTLPEHNISTIPYLPSSVQVIVLILAKRNRSPFAIVHKSSSSILLFLFGYYELMPTLLLAELCFHSLLISSTVRRHDMDDLSPSTVQLQIVICLQELARDKFHFLMSTPCHRQSEKRAQSIWYRRQARRNTNSHTSPGIKQEST
jgi:hypothetical protein